MLSLSTGIPMLHGTASEFHLPLNLIVLGLFLCRNLSGPAWGKTHGTEPRSSLCRLWSLGKARRL